MTIRVLHGDCRTVLPTLEAASVQCVVTSPPFFNLRDYGVAGQMGLEATPAAYVAELVGVFREVKRVLRNDGVLFLNLGDSYLANKQLIGIPWRVGFALQDDGWWLRQDNIWHKGNAIPESVRDRTTRVHEYVFMLSKAPSYYYDAKAIEEPAAVGWNGSKFHTGKTALHQLGRASQTERQESMFRNRRSVWTINSSPYADAAHFATMPEELATICILAGSRPGDMVLDCFGGVGTTGAVAARLGRDATLIDLNPAYCRSAERRGAGETPPLPW